MTAMTNDGNEQSLLEAPEATLEQLGLADAAFGSDFHPAYCAMDDGIDSVGGCWYLFEERPSFNPATLSWVSNGNAWEIGIDGTDDLRDTPVFQRRVKPEFSLVKIVKVATGEPRYSSFAYLE